MSSFFDSGPLPDWKDLRKLLGKDIPWDLVAKWDQQKESDWLNQYMKEMLNQPKPVATTYSQGGVLSMETTKSAKYVNVTIRLAPYTDLKQLQLFASSDRLKVMGLPLDKKRIVYFPCLVYARSGRAEYKKEQLKIRFKRRRLEKTEYELFIRT